MQSIQNIFKQILVIYLFFMLISCSIPAQFSGSSDDQNDSASLDKLYGGFDTKNEEIAFGDEELLNELTADAEVDDEISSDPEIIADLSSDLITAYFSRITWGYLDGNPDAELNVDWSGSIEVNRGTLVILRTIRFEGHDHIDLPRESRKKITFSSFTKPHFDGIAIAIIDNEPSSDIEGVLKINAGLYSKELTFSELESIELIESFGSAGHEVSIIGREKDLVPFAGGFLDGHWIKTRPHGGEFKGRWIHSTGLNAGYLKGIWGIDKQKNKVFYGKYINYNGKFQGLIAGNWDYIFDDNIGSFKGHWIAKDFTKIGILLGHFKTGYPGDRRGFFHGHWHVVSSLN